MQLVQLEELFEHVEQGDEQGKQLSSFK